MSRKCTHVETSILFKSARAPLDKIGHPALKKRLASIGVDLQAIRSQAGEYILVDCDKAQVLIANCNFPFPLDHFKGVTRPVESEAHRIKVQRDLASHKSSITVIVSDVDRAPAPELCTLAALEVLDYLIAQTAPDLVYWADNDRLLTPPEAEILIAELELADEQAATDHQWEGLKPSEIRFTRALGEAAHPGHFKAEPDLSNEVLSWFTEVEKQPEPEPERDLQQALTKFLALQEGADAKRLADTALGRSSLYVMSATIMVFALPVGATALTYNALSGGSLRVTAHMMALTGFGLALTAIGMPSPASALEFLL